jgi:hypothetical protein
MEEQTTRPNKLKIERGFAPTRLSEETLIGIYDQVLQVAAKQHAEEQPLESLVGAQPEHTTRTGGRS